jgi:hypothetical protein
MFVTACVGIVVALVCLPFSLVAIFVFRDDKMACDRDTLKVLGMPGIVISCFLAGTVMFAVQVAWIFVALLYVVLLFLTSWVGFRTDTTGLLPCTSRTGDMDRMLEIFLFPLLFSMSVSGVMNN